MFFKKSIKKIKKDFEKDKENLKTFYSNPNKYLSKTHYIVRILLVLYIVGFVLILRFAPEDADSMIYRLVYIVAGYFVLSFLHDRLK